MRKSLPYLVLALWVISPLSAQRYLLKDGKVLKQDEVVLKGDALVKSLGAGMGEIEYALSQVVKMDWPEPAEIAQARQLLASGNAGGAEAKITPIYTQFTPFAKIPGSWWADAALIRARCLLAQQKKSTAEQAALEILSTSLDTDLRLAAQMILVRLQIAQGKRDSAEEMLAEIMGKDCPSEIAAEAAVLRGDIAYAQKAFEAAIEFYLQVPAFYGTADEIMPGALLGSARAFRGYGDSVRAERAYLDLIAAYPASAEAATAKREQSEL